ncbi:GNAT family N-acetyltransferase [Orlajensenia leifsoniae]|uniref:GNAT family N-acetyltransferase n=1 Tax=Orlajensenia leifsoniae TaxID=2561933 RepID=A0A4Y9QX28_9MICO|nr:GNAT family N-acetyltransferase [Leifsonia flava]TFV96949.1 GNAT family N-acetyltransferase [Leifsonia flava]
MTAIAMRHAAIAPPSVYFTTAYGQADATGSASADWISLSSADGRWQIPLVVTKAAEGVKFASTPNGYAGIWADPDLSRSEIDASWQASLAALGSAGIVTVFLRFAPFAPDARFDGLPGLDAQRISATCLVHVDASDAMWGRMAGRARTAIRKASNTGMRVAVAPMEGAQSDSMRRFRRLYDSTMNRIGAAERYRFDDSYFSRLAELGSRLHVASVVDSRGETVAAALVLLDPTVAHYHLAGSDPEAARSGANNLLVWGIMEHAQRVGRTAVHLGGGRSDRDSLHKFKSSFGSEDMDFRIGRLVVDEDRYLSLIDKRAKELSTSPSALLAQGFFPAFAIQPS